MVIAETMAVCDAAERIEVNALPVLVELESARRGRPLLHEEALRTMALTSPLATRRRSRRSSVRRIVTGWLKIVGQPVMVADGAARGGGRLPGWPPQDGAHRLPERVRSGATG
ncbi:MAG: hypothetical protein R3C69_11270 [Geminicoccaceae bacterium]